MIGPYEPDAPPPAHAGWVAAAHATTGERVRLYSALVEDDKIRGHKMHALRACEAVRHAHLASVTCGEDASRVWAAVDVGDSVPFFAWLDGADPAAPAPSPLDDDAQHRINAPERLLRLRVVLSQIARALAVLHDADIVHRAVSAGALTSTIRVTSDSEGVAMLLPTEHALVEGRDHDGGMVVDDFKYLAPEQALGNDIDGRADLYSLGVVLYEAVAGRRPFYSENSVGYAFLHVRRPPPAILDVNAGADRDLARIALDLMCKDPRERQPRSAHDLARMLAP